jgi:hypothetical protein
MKEKARNMKMFVSTLVLTASKKEVWIEQNGCFVNRQDHKKRMAKLTAKRRSKFVCPQGFKRINGGRLSPATSSEPSGGGTKGKKLLSAVSVRAENVYKGIQKSTCTNKRIVNRVSSAKDNDGRKRTIPRL